MNQKLSTFLKTTKRKKTTGTVAKFKDTDGDWNDPDTPVAYCLIGAMGCELGKINIQYDVEYFDGNFERLDEILEGWGITKSSRSDFITGNDIERVLGKTILEILQNTHGAQVISGGQLVLYRLLAYLNDSLPYNFPQLGHLVELLEKAGIIRYTWEKTKTSNVKKGYN